MVLGRCVRQRVRDRRDWNAEIMHTPTHAVSLRLAVAASRFPIIPPPGLPSISWLKCATLQREVVRCAPDEIICTSPMLYFIVTVL